MPTTPDALEDSVPSGSRQRVITIALVALVAVAVTVAVLSWFKPRWRTWCHGVTKAEYQKKLLEEQDPALIDVIDDVMRDDDQTDGVRITLGQVLIQKNRIGVVEKALKDPRLDVRVIAIQVLATQRFFQKQYVEDEAYGVRRTLEQWLLDPSGRSLGQAAALAAVVYPELGDAPDTVVGAIRAMIVPPPGGATQPGARAAASITLAGWGDCAAAPALLARAKTDPEAFARLRILQSAVQLFDLKACPDALPEAEVVAATVAALDWPGDGDLNRAVRMGAVGILARHTTWALDRTDLLRRRVDDPATHEVERRAIFDALAQRKDATTVASLPRVLHDEVGALRAAAVAALCATTPPIPEVAANACLAGYLRDEPGGGTYAFTVRQAYQAIRARAGQWVGLPAQHRERGGSIVELSDVLTPLFDKGAFEGTTREQVVDAVWRWVAGKAGLAGDDVEAAMKGRAAFWAKARAGDVAGASEALAPLLAADRARAKDGQQSGLWAYEGGWLAAHPVK